MSLANWDEIRTAFQVARLGTVSGAADVLGVHHATVIRHIDALEKRLGSKLFQRHARGMVRRQGRVELQAAGDHGAGRRGAQLQLLSGVKAGDTAAILSETQSRPVNVQLAELALARLGARAFHLVLSTPRLAAPVPVRSTGASDAIGGLAPVVQALAQAMDGVITDDAGQLLSVETMDSIGADLESLYDALDSRDLSAGSPQARRLIS